jgi:hypothetical protein
VEPLDEATRLRERLMLGLRLDEPLPVGPIAPALDRQALARLERLQLATHDERSDGEWLSLTRSGRFLGGGVTAELLRM